MRQTRRLQGEPNISYISSRFYRAPELIFDATHYTTSIGARGGHRGRSCPVGPPRFGYRMECDRVSLCTSRALWRADVWSFGCIVAELLLGEPLFCGQSRPRPSPCWSIAPPSAVENRRRSRMRNVRSMEQVLEIITVIGTPSKGDIQVCCPRVKKHARQCLAQCSRHPSAAVRTYTRGRAQTYFTGFGPFRANKCVPQRHGPSPAPAAHCITSPSGPLRCGRR